jgi:hypothetical protein
MGNDGASKQRNEGINLLRSHIPNHVFPVFLKYAVPNQKRSHLHLPTTTFDNGGAQTACVDVQSVCSVQPSHLLSHAQG